MALTVERERPVLLDTSPTGYQIYRNELVPIDTWRASLKDIVDKQRVDPDAETRTAQEWAAILFDKDPVTKHALHEHACLAKGTCKLSLHEYLQLNAFEAQHFPEHYDITVPVKRAVVYKHSSRTKKGYSVYLIARSALPALVL